MRCLSRRRERSPFLRAKCSRPTKRAARFRILLLKRKALEQETVRVLVQPLHALYADHPLLGVAEVPDVGRHVFGRSVYALLDGNRASVADVVLTVLHPQPSSLIRFSSKPK